MADFKNTTPDKLTICLLERERHDHIVKDAKQLGTKIKFISDGDVAGAIYAGIEEFKVDIYLGKKLIFLSEVKSRSELELIEN